MWDNALYMYSVIYIIIFHLEYSHLNKYLDPEQWYFIVEI